MSPGWVSAPAPAWWTATTMNDLRSIPELTSHCYQDPALPGARRLFASSGRIALVGYRVSGEGELLGGKGKKDWVAGKPITPFSINPSAAHPPFQASPLLCYPDPCVFAPITTFHCAPCITSPSRLLLRHHG